MGESALLLVVLDMLKHVLCAVFVTAAVVCLGRPCDYQLQVASPNVLLAAHNCTEQRIAANV